MRNTLKLLSLSGLIVGLAACGQNQEPLSLLGEQTDRPPALELPVASGSFNQVSPYVAQSQAYFQLTQLPAGATITAPAAGVVSAVDVYESMYSVTIYHGLGYSSRVQPVVSVLRPGDRVAVGSTIGTSAAGIMSTLEFAVLVDGNPVCPYQFLSTNALAALAGRIAGLPCL